MKIIIYMASCFLLLSCSDSHWHNDEAAFLSEESYLVLIKDGICTNLNECRADEYVFFRTQESFVTINIYKIVSKRIQIDVCEDLKSQFEDKKYIVKVNINFYGLPHGSENNAVIFQCVIPKGNNESN